MMRYLPARCDACCVVNLISEQACQHGETSCLDCGASASVIPGCAYSAEDLALFLQLRDVVEQAELSTVEAGELALIIDSLSGCSDDHRVFSNLMEHVPALAPALLVLTSHPSRARQALTLLSTMIQDRAFARVSGMLQMAPEQARQRGAS
jgi:hypothetical protein